MNPEAKPYSRTIASCLIVLLIALMGCSTLDPIILDDEYALAPANADLWFEVSQVRSDEWAYLLNSGEQALEWRLRAIDSATESIDLQTFLWFEDTVGMTIQRHLLKAADRGVRVRLLLDDTFTATHEEAILSLDEHPNIELRIYNPFQRRSSNMVVRQLVNLGDFHRLDHRMHNKALLVDNRALLIGGRNQADEYFGWHGEANFRDLELICMGPVVEEVSRFFDVFWNNNWSFPLDKILKEGRVAPPGDAGPEILANGADLYLDETDSERLSQWMNLAKGGLAIQTRVLADIPAPDRPGLEGELPDQLAAELVEQIKLSQSELILVSAYLIPTPEFEEAIEAAEARGVEVKILTNSIRSNNHLSAHSSYRRHIHKLMEGGADLHEVRIYAKDRSRYMLHPVDEKHLGLHAKFLLIDDSLSVIGSANLDPRSLRLNTEMSLLIESRELNARLRELIEVDFDTGNAWHLQRQPDGSVNWVGDDAILENQPAGSRFLQLEDWFLSILPLEEEL